jgi:hypothetical protein
LKLLVAKICRICVCVTLAQIKISHSSIKYIELLKIGHQGCCLVMQAFDTDFKPYLKKDA